MTSLTITEEASLFLTIKDEAGAKWETHSPEYKYEWEDKTISVAELLIASISTFIYIVVVPATIELQIELEIFLMFFGLLIYAVYMAIRSKVIRRNHVTKRDQAIATAKRSAESYVSQRCSEAGVNLHELQQWVDEEVERYDLLSDLFANGIVPTAWSK